MCFRDASRAFDCVNHANLFRILQERGVPLYLIQISHHWYSRQTMQIRWGNAPPNPFSITNGVRRGIKCCLLFFLISIWMICLRNYKSVRLDVWWGDRRVNHLMHADDLIVLLPYRAGQQQLLRACSDYGMQYDIKSHRKKSVVMIARTKEDQQLSDCCDKGKMPESHYQDWCGMLSESAYCSVSHTCSVSVICAALNDLHPQPHHVKCQSRVDTKCSWNS